MSKIDFVITWVDGSDPVWQKEKAKYSGKKEKEKTDIGRFRDWGFLPYWFRSVEKYAPWVNKIHFVTYGHLPEWLNTAHPKLNIVRHDEFIPEKYLPTFSANPIELNMFRIKGLEEKFIYFNDDFFLNDYVEPDFFYKEDLPCDFILLKYLFFFKIWDGFNHMLGNNQAVINTHFNMKTLRQHWKKILNIHYSYSDFRRNFLIFFRFHNAIPLFSNPHLPLALLKSDFEQFWQLEPELCDATSCHKFRTASDITYWVIRDMRLCRGQFFPIKRKDRGKYFSLEHRSACEIAEEIGQKHKMFCINDGYSSWEQFEEDKAILLKAFEQKHPVKSSFEL